MTKDERDAIEWLLQKAEMAYLFAEGWHSRESPLRRPGWIGELRDAHTTARAFFPERADWRNTMPAINIRLTEAELAYLHELADAEGRSMNNYVRRQLFASSPTPLRTRIDRRRVAKDTLIG